MKPRTGSAAVDTLDLCLVCRDGTCVLLMSKTRCEGRSRLVVAAAEADGFCRRMVLGCSKSSWMYAVRRGRSTDAARGTVALFFSLSIAANSADASLSFRRRASPRFLSKSRFDGEFSGLPCELNEETCSFRFVALTCSASSACS